MTEKFILGAADYVMLGLMLAISAAIGLYFRLRGGQQKTNEEYILAGRDMSICPVAFSLMATFMSTTTLMGIPAEMYLYGTNMTFMNIGFILGPLISSFLFLPIYFKTGVATAYEYLERRFGKTTRRILSAIFLFQNILFNGLCLYAPALALSAVTNLTIWSSVISIGVACTCYCTLGGIKAVLWADVFQSILMYACLFAIIIKGCMDLGGIQSIFKTAYEGGRILLPTFEMDFSIRYTMWSILLQGLIINTYAYCGTQNQVQRQLTLKTLRRSIIANLISAPMVVVLHLLSCLCGLIFYVYFQSCDPMTSPTKPIHLADQLLPYYITSTMRQYPGLPGLCIAGVFSASLSTISSGVNSMAAVTYEDIIRPMWPNLTGSVFITKAASIFYGLLSIFLTYLVVSLGNLVKSSLLVIGLTSGPGLGVFLLAALTTTANEMGANVGVIAGVALGACITFIPNVRHYPELPLGKNCSSPVNTSDYSVNSNFYSTVNMSALYTDVSKMTTISTKEKFPPDNFPVSYMWISSFSLFVTIAVGYFGSWSISYLRKKSQPVPAILLSPLQRWFVKDNVIQNGKEITKNEHVNECSSTRF